MSILSMQALADHGLQRRINPYFEWAGITDPDDDTRSPVDLAIEVSKENSIAVALCFLFLVLGIPGTLGWIALANFHEVFPDSRANVESVWNFELYLFASATLSSVSAVVSLIVGVLSKLSFFKLDSETKMFREDLTRLMYLLGDVTVLNCGNFASKTSLRKLATKVLENLSFSALKVQGRMEARQGGPTHSDFSEQALIITDLSRVYDLFVRYHLASGGWKEYFKAAKIALRERNEAIATEVLKSGSDGIPFGVPG